MKFSTSDALVTAGAAVLSTAILVLFFNDLYAITTHGDERPLGTIVFKKQTATRKGADSQVWERLSNESPVYQSDTIRTAEGSEAVIHFDEGLSLNLFENTMLKLTMGAAPRLDVTEGTIAVTGSSQNGAPLALGQGGQSVVLSPDAHLVVRRQHDTMSLELSGGTAALSDGQGHVQDLSPTQAVDLNTASGEVKVRAVDLIPSTPVPGSRSLVFGSTVDVGVEYQLTPAVSDPDGVEVQASDTGTFDNPLRARGTDRGPGPQGRRRGASLALTPGTWSWRLVAADGTVAGPWSFTLTPAAAPQPLAPAAGTTVFFRKKRPEVRFAWAPGESVRAWDLEIAPAGDGFGPRSVKRRTTLTSLTTELGPGTWVWRVVPLYDGPAADRAPDPVVRTVSVVARSEMTPVSVAFPVEGTVVQAQELATRGLSLTWNPEAEAVGYELSVATDAAPAARFLVPAPYAVLTPHDLEAVARPGTLVWRLTWIDAEGNRSPAGPPRTVRVVDGALALRAVYPPDGYTVYDQYLTNTRFSWKSNLNLRTSFQVATTEDFAQPLADEPATDGTRLGKAWGRGTLYWRLVSYNVDGTVFVKTPPRRLEVVGPFPPVVLSDPPGGNALVDPGQTAVALRWPPVPGADGYQVSVRKTVGNDAVTVWTGETGGGPSPGLPLGAGLPDGAYTIRVQAFAQEKALSSSIVGYYGDTEVQVTHLQTTRLLNPAPGATLPGLEARRRGVTLAWENPHLSGESVVEVLRLPGTLVFRGTTALTSLHLPRLDPGVYQWRPSGGYLGHDLSPVPARFEVLPVARLAAPALEAPVEGTVVGPAQLRASRALDFRWGPVAGATVYEFRIESDGPTPLVRARGTAPTYRVANLGVLGRGTFRWTVEAQNQGPDGVVDQQGIVAQARFTIELPTLAVPQLPEEKLYFGR